MTAPAQARGAMRALVLGAALGVCALETLSPATAFAQAPAAAKIGYVDTKRLLDNAPQVVAGLELRLARRDCELVPGTDRETVIAAVDAIADRGPELSVDMTFVLDRQI